MHTLLIYEMVPEETKLYLIPDSEMTPQWLEYLTQAQNRYGNADSMNAGMEFLNTALASKAEYCSDDHPPDWKCCFHKYLVGRDQPLNGPISRVFSSGFIL